MLEHFAPNISSSRTGTFKVLPFVCILLFGISFADTRDCVELYNDGNKAYRSKDWNRAIEHYLSAIDCGAVSSELFYNLGCAYYRVGDIGRAILWFERARMLAPRDDDIKKNLAFTRRMTKDKIESIYRNTLLIWFWNILESLSFSEFWWLLLIISAIATAGTAYSILQLRGYYFALVLWLIFILLAGCWYVKCDRLWETHLAVVIAPKLDVRSTPSDDGEILFTIHSGTRVGIREKRREWYRITIEDGHTGWANAQAIEPVLKQ